MFKSNNISLTSIIGESTIIDGNINSKLSVRIDGRVNGNIFANSSIVISLTGDVHGNIECTGNIIIEGHLKGDVKADFVKIGPKAKIEGNIDVKNISIEKGAIIDSTIRMTDPIETKD